MKKNYFLITVVVVIMISALILKINQISNNNREAENIIENSENIADMQNEGILDDALVGDNIIVGGDKDEYGCIPSAGYSWCESKEKCLRIWEEDCPSVLSPENEIKEPVKVVVSSPLPGDIITSPLEVKGKALGNWFFEAILPLKLVTEDGEIISDYYAQAESDWMSEDFVPFSGTLEFSTTASNGYLVVNRNNPSGLKEHDSQIRIPIKFNNE